MAHRFVIAIRSLAAEVSDIRELAERSEPVGSEGGAVPEERQPEEAVECGERGESGVRERAVDRALKRGLSR